MQLFASFRVGRFSRDDWQGPAGTTVAELVAELKLPEEEIGVVLVNRRHVDLDRVLEEGDICAIFPLIGGG